jgi:hypothetical protein
MRRGVGIVARQFVVAGETKTSWNFVVGRVIDTGVATTGASKNAILNKRESNHAISFSVPETFFYWTYSLVDLQLFNILEVVSNLAYGNKFFKNTSLVFHSSSG